MVPLPAGAVVEDRLAAVAVDDATEPGGHLGDGRVPVDLLVRAVGPAAHRGGQAVPPVLVVVEAQSLLAGVALRGGVGLVAPDPLEAAPVLTAPADLDAAVDVAEDAGRRLPVRSLHGRLLQCAMSRCQLGVRSLKRHRDETRGETDRPASVSTCTSEIRAAPTEVVSCPNIDTGDTAWVLASTALVLFMTPGLAFFYAGMVRAKHVLAMLMQNFFAMGIVTVLWVLFGYSLAFGDAGNGGFIGNFDFIGLKDMTGAGLGHHPDDGVLRLPADLRRHHPGPDHRGDRRPDALGRLGRLHRPVVDPRLPAGGPLGLRRRVAGRPRRPRLRRWHGRPRQRRRRGSGAGPPAREAEGLAELGDAAALASAGHAGHGHPLVRVVRFQRRLGAGGQPGRRRRRS